MPKITPQTIGHSWKADDNISPNIIESRHCVLPQVQFPKRSCYPYWVIDYDFISSCDYKLDDQPKYQPRPAGRIHLYPPNTVYWEKPKPEIKQTDCSWLIFDGKLDSHLDKFVKPQGYCVFEDNKGKVGLLLKSAAKISQQQGHDAQWKVQSILSNILHKFSTAKIISNGLWEIPSEQTPNESGNSLADNVAIFLRSRLTEKITVEMIAEYLGMSESSLAHKYKNQAGATPIATLISMRIELAKTLLRRGYKLQYIASHTGFSDEYHLAKTFKRITGQTPGQFIKKS